MNRNLGGWGGWGGGVIQQNTYVWRRSFHVGKQTKTEPGGRGEGGGRITVSLRGFHVGEQKGGGLRGAL